MSSLNFKTRMNLFTVYLQGYVISKTATSVGRIWLTSAGRDSDSHRILECKGIINIYFYVCCCSGGHLNGHLKFESASVLRVLLLATFCEAATIVHQLYCTQDLFNSQNRFLMRLDNICDTLCVTVKNSIHIYIMNATNP